MIDKIKKALLDMQQQNPLVLNLTNFVTMDFVANCLLALGAAPIMSTCEEELEELIKLSSVLYINTGTLNPPFISFTKKAIELAVQYHKPIVFDPVGAGATQIRTETAKEICPFATIIRGNASEIIALSDQRHITKGVESIHTTDEAKEIAQDLALKYQTTVIVSGAIDFVTDGLRSAEVIGGSPLMQRVTGMGCAMTAVIAAFKAIVDDSFEAGLIGAHYFAFCGTSAALHHQNSGSFKTAFIDQLNRQEYEPTRNIL